MRFRAIAAVAALCLLAVGCGGKNEAKPTPTTHEKYVPVVPEKISEGTGACALLTQGEVAAAVGLPANPGDGIQSEGGGSCHWSLRGSGAQSVNLVTLTPGGSPYEQTLSTAPKPIEPLSGVGDHAFIATDTVWAFKGPRVIAVQVNLGQPLSVRKQYATTLAQAAIARA